MRALEKAASEVVFDEGATDSIRSPFTVPNWIPSHSSPLANLQSKPLPSRTFPTRLWGSMGRSTTSKAMLRLQRSPPRRRLPKDIVGRRSI